MADASSLPASPWREGSQAAIVSAPDVEALAAVAAQQRQQAADALRTGADVLATTQRISQLSDWVSERLVRLHADELGLDLQRVCWLVFGSQGRGEQTLATDQDNGLVFESDDVSSARSRWL
jgi:CBS domain-containing protein